MDILDHVIHTKDLFELVVQQALREEGKAFGAIGLNADEPILSFDFADESENNTKLGSQVEKKVQSILLGRGKMTMARWDHGAYTN